MPTSQSLVTLIDAMAQVIKEVVDQSSSKERVSGTDAVDKEQHVCPTYPADATITVLKNLIGGMYDMYTNGLDISTALRMNEEGDKPKNKKAIDFLGVWNKAMYYARDGQTDSISADKVQLICEGCATLYSFPKATIPLYFACQCGFTYRYAPHEAEFIRE